MDEDFTYDGHYHFNFLPSGFFTLLNQKQEPYYAVALVLLEKLINHLVWIFFWLVLLLASRYLFPVPWIPYVDKVLMALIVGHLFFFGCRLTTLLLRGGVKPLLFPPLWIKVTKQIQKGQGIDLLKKYNLDRHPGLLANLAIAEYSRKEYEKATATLRLALAHAPDHPALKELLSAISQAKH